MRSAVDRIAGTLVLIVGLGLWLAPLSPAGAQGSADFSSMMSQFVRSTAIWSLLVLGLYIVCLGLASRTAGLEGGVVTGCLATLVGVGLGAVLLAPLAFLAGDYLSQTMWAVLGQLLGLLALCWGVKLVFRTSWSRALLTLLLASVLVVTLSGIALMVIF